MHKNRAVLAATLATLTVLGAAGCSSGAGAAPKSDPKAPLTVWVDAGRVDQAKAYAKAHPEVKITVNSVASGAGDVTTKISLAKKANSAVPDVVFITTPEEITNLVVNPINYPLALNDLVPKKTQDGYPGTNAQCTYNGKLYCLRNDIGQTVFWYNKPLFEKWGYTVPKTFQEFKQLGLDLGKNHPGYSLGTVSGSYGLDSFFGSSGCPILDATSVTAVKIDTADPKCTRVGDVISPLLANGTLSNLDLWDKTYVSQVAAGKMVGMIGPSWEADFALKPWTTDSGAPFDGKGKYAAAPMPTWDGEKTNWSGGAGGGIWVVSATTKNPKAAVAFATAMTTDPAIAKTQGTYPAYGPSADVWLKAKDTDTWYAENPAQVLKDAAAKINPADGYVRYQSQLLDSYNATVVKNGASDMAGALKEFGAQADKMAKAIGYTVSK